MCAVESPRGCGLRKIHGMYLVGEYIPVNCDRLPFPIGKCPICGQGTRFPRSPSLIFPDKLFGQHEGCKDEHQPCFLCQPEKDKVGYLLGVGKEYTPQSFLVEGITRGFSKRIHQIPRHLKLGETVVYLCHNEAYDIPDDSPDVVKVGKKKIAVEPTGILNVPKTKKGLGIFTAFIPQRIEMLFYKSEITDKLREQMAKRNITIVEIPDGDLDHAPAKLRRKLLKKFAPKQSRQPPPLPLRDKQGHFVKTRRST